MQPGTLLAHTHPGLKLAKRHPSVLNVIKMHNPAGPAQRLIGSGRRAVVDLAGLTVNV